MSERRRAISLATGLLSLGALAALFAFACSGPGSHVLSGRRYLPERDCVEALTAIDVVEGPDPGRACEPLCIIGQSPLIEGPGVYVTTQCPPYPPTFDLSVTNPDCAAAYEAFARLDVCKAEGSSNPRDAGDAGDDLDAEAEDASTEDAGAVTDAGEILDAGESTDASEPDASADDAGDAGLADADTP